MKSVIIGRGTVGCSIARRIKDASFVFDEKRKTSLGDKIFLNGKEISNKAYLSLEYPFKVDLIILCVKNYSLESVIPLIKEIADPHTIILSLLNGIDAYPYLSNIFKDNVVVGGFVQGLSAYKDGDNVYEFVPPKIIIGDESGRLSLSIKRIEEYFSSYDLECIISDNIKKDRWLKFMNNVCFNTLTSLLGVDYSLVNNNLSIIRACRVISKEVRAVSNEEGVKITSDDVDQMIKSMTTLSGNGKSSMLEDMEKHRETENRFFCGKISSLGKKYGIPTPICDFLYILVEAKRGI